MHSQTIRVRDADKGDIDRLTVLATQVQTLHAEGRPDLFRPADPDALRTFFSERMSAGSIVLVAEHAGATPDGYVLAEVIERPQSPFQFQHTSVYVHHIAVDERARRTGVGDLLIGATVERACRAGATSIRLDSWSFNREAHRFFEAQGFNAARYIFERPVSAS